MTGMKISLNTNDCHDSLGTPGFLFLSSDSANQEAQWRLSRGSRGPLHRSHCFIHSKEKSSHQESGLRRGLGNSFPRKLNSKQHNHNRREELVPKQAGARKCLVYRKMPQRTPLCHDDTNTPVKNPPHFLKSFKNYTGQSKNRSKCLYSLFVEFKNSIALCTPPLKGQ